MMKLRSAAAALTVVLAMIFLTADPAVAWPPAVANGHIVASVSATPYEATLDWDTCAANDGTYMYLETHSSGCGSRGWGAVWSYAFASYSGGSPSFVAVCHSDDHSSVTTMYFSLWGGGSGAISDSAGGGCHLSQVPGRVTTYFVTWGNARSPTVRANY